MEVVIFLVALCGKTVSQQVLPLPDELITFESFHEHYSSDRTRFSPDYHVTNPGVWLNNPAGFTKFNQQYHIFYQFHPYDGTWGYVNWGHIVSSNLVDWAHWPSALTPLESYERQGCLAGSAVVHNNFINLFYTGTAIVNNKTLHSQNVAISSVGVNFKKYMHNPVIKLSKEFESDFINPKVWVYGDNWYMIVAAISKENHAQMVLYTSTDMFHWKRNGTIARSYGDMGYMWENPDFFEIGGEDVLMFNARGIHIEGCRFRNIYQTGYLVGKFNYAKNRFDEPFEASTATFNELDRGHDFYAPQTMLDSDGRRLLVAWLGMMESNYQEFKEGWAGMLTVVRELKLSPEGRLLMTPVRELKGLRLEKQENAWYSPGQSYSTGCRAFELIVRSRKGANLVELILEWSSDKDVRERQFKVTYDAKQSFVSIDRGGEDGVRRADWAPESDKVHWRIFVDYISVEIFCGKGEVVFSSRIYPRRTIFVTIGGDTPLHIVQYKLRRAGLEDHKGENSSPASYFQLGEQITIKPEAKS